MEEKKKFICKFCNKKYPCGKSLGGHIRTHMTQHCSTKDTVKLDQNNIIDAARKKRKKIDLGSDYGLRENPRKTTRFVHSPNPTSLLHHHQHQHNNDLNEKFCKECGKGFPSLKALCGHMACHSEKEKQKLVMMDNNNTHSVTDTSCVPKGSKRMRFMTLNNNNSNHTSSSVSEVDEQEQEEEIAMCLMLLSKDFSCHKDRFALPTTQSNSDNNSVVLEAKSPTLDAATNKSKIKNSVSYKVRKDMNFKLSDSGYFKYGPEKVDSDASIDGGNLRNDVFNRPKVRDSYKFVQDYDDDVSESRKMMNKKCSKKSVLENLDYDSFNRANIDDPSRNLDVVSYKKNGCYDSESYESDEKSTDSTESDSYPSSSVKPRRMKRKLNSKKRKEHECPICNKTFRSGQALGGHKRSHFVGGFEENNNNVNTIVLKQDSPSPSPPHAVHCLIDLNLPAPIDDE